MTEIQNCIERLSSTDEAERIYAAEDIGYANQLAGVAPLLARLREEPSRAVREAIFAALLQIEDDAVIEGALVLLDSEDSFLRNQAVALLQALGAKALPQLARAFQEGDRDRRKFVVDIVARLADTGASDLYTQALQDPDMNVVITAVESFANTRQFGFREQIESLISPDAHPMLLGACIEALAQIGDAGSLDAVRRSFGTGHALPGYLQPAYLKLVGAKGGASDVDEIGMFAGAPSLDAAVLNSLTVLRNRRVAVTLPLSLAQRLEEMASRNQPALAYEAVRLLSGLAQHEEVFEYLVGCLGHPEKVVRIGAIQALCEAGGERAETVLRARLAGETDEEVLQAWGGQSAK
jgi:HEAT repeat protein